jgi:hypothetical protein
VPALPKILNKKPHIEKRIHAALEDRRAKRDAEYARTSEPGIMLSSVGDCQRVLWAQLHGIPQSSEPPSGRTLLIFDLGNVVENEVIRLLRLADFAVSTRDVINGGQHRVVAYDGKVRGRLDGIVSLGRKFEKDAVLEIKTAKLAKFEELIACGYEVWNPKYADTLHAYMGLGGYKRALVVVYCKDDSRLYCEVVPFDAGRFAAIQRKLEYVIGAGDEIVDRPDDATSEYCQLCKWCSHREWCWGPLAGVRFDP